MMLNNPNLIRLWVALGACGITFGGGCSRAQQPAQQPGAAPKQASPQPTAPQPTATQPGAAASAAGTTQATWAPDALEQLVAPIALYPDQLVGQILAASVNSQEVLDAGNWLLQNQNLQGDALDAAATKAGFGPAMRALVRFPTVVDMMCQNIDWTRQLGTAFTSDQKGLLDAVQRLRVQAEKVGNLKSTPEQKVETRTEDNKTVVEVKPADPQVVYVPQYNPQVVYTTPPAAAPAESTSHDEGVSTETAVGAGLVGFGTGVLLGSALNHDDDCCYPSWGASSVYVGARPFYPPAYAYRPAYGAGFRPAYGYTRPAGYRYGYDNARVSGNRRNVNINNNYFNQYNHNQNLRTGAAGGGWKDQSTYAGARNPTVNERRNQAAGRTTPGAGATGPGAARNQSQTRPGAGAGAGARAGAGTGARVGAGAAPRAGAGAGAGTGAGARTGAGSPSRSTLPADRGFGTSTRGSAGQGAARAPAPSQRSLDTGTSRADAFGGGRGSGGGSFDRQASARGRSSAGGRSFGGGRGGGRRR